MGSNGGASVQYWERYNTQLLAFWPRTLSELDFNQEKKRRDKDINTSPRTHSPLLNLYHHSLPCSLSSLHSTNDRSSNQISHYVMLIKWNVVTSIFVQRLSLDLSLSYGCGDTVTFDNSISLGHCSNSFMATNKGINYITSYRQSVLLRKETKLYSEIMNIINIVLKQNFNWNSSASFPSRQFQILHKPNYINFRIFDFLSQFSVPDLITCVTCSNTSQPRVSRKSCVPTLLNQREFLIPGLQ